MKMMQVLSNINSEYKDHRLLSCLAGGSTIAFGAVAGAIYLEYKRNDQLEQVKQAWTRARNKRNKEIGDDIIRENFFLEIKKEVSSINKDFVRLLNRLIKIGPSAITLDGRRYRLEIKKSYNIIERYRDKREEHDPYDLALLTVSAMLLNASVFDGKANHDVQVEFINFIKDFLHELVYVGKANTRVGHFEMAFTHLNKALCYLDRMKFNGSLHDDLGILASHLEKISEESVILVAFSALNSKFDYRNDMVRVSTEQIALGRMIEHVKGIQLYPLDQKNPFFHRITAVADFVSNNKQKYLARRLIYSNNLEDEKNSKIDNALCLKRKVKPFENPLLMLIGSYPGGKFLIKHNNQPERNRQLDFLLTLATTANDMKNIVDCVQIISKDFGDSSIHEKEKIGDLIATLKSLKDQMKEIFNKCGELRKAIKSMKDAVGKIDKNDISAVREYSDKFEIIETSLRESEKSVNNLDFLQKNFKQWKNQSDKNQEEFNQEHEEVKIFYALNGEQKTEQTEKSMKKKRLSILAEQRVNLKIMEGNQESGLDSELKDVEEEISKIESELWTTKKKPRVCLISADQKPASIFNNDNKVIVLTYDNNSIIAYCMQQNGKTTSKFLQLDPEDLNKLLPLFPKNDQIIEVDDKEIVNKIIRLCVSTQSDVSQLAEIPMDWRLDQIHRLRNLAEFCKQHEWQIWKFKIYGGYKLEKGMPATAKKILAIIEKYNEPKDYKNTKEFKKHEIKADKVKICGFLKAGSGPSFFRNRDLDTQQKYQELLAHLNNPKGKPMPMPKLPEPPNPSPG